ncbi:unnamed protein product [Victoria cruziana]
MGGSVMGLCLPSPASISLSKRLPRTSFGGLRLTTTYSLSSGVKVAADPSLGRSSRRNVVMMAKREEELKEIRAMTTEQINDEVIDLKGELFMLRLQRSARNEFKSSEFGRMRKRVARMLTVKRERETEEGINKRLSRKLDRKWKRSIVVRPPPSLRKKQAEEKAAAEEKST